MQGRATEPSCELTSDQGRVGCLGGLLYPTSMFRGSGGHGLKRSPLTCARARNSQANNSRHERVRPAGCGRNCCDARTFRSADNSRSGRWPSGVQGPRSSVRPSIYMRTRLAQLARPGRATAAATAAARPRRSTSGPPIAGQPREGRARRLLGLHASHARHRPHARRSRTHCGAALRVAAAHPAMSRNAATPSDQQRGLGQSSFRIEAPAMSGAAGLHSQDSHPNLPIVTQTETGFGPQVGSSFGCLRPSSAQLAPDFVRCGQIMAHDNTVWLCSNAAKLGLEKGPNLERCRPNLGAESTNVSPTRPGTGTIRPRSAETWGELDPDK